MISLVVYIVGTCVWCLYKLNRCREIQKKYINIVTLTFDFEMQGQT